MSASAGRKGRRWRKARAEVLATSDVCHLCGHGGAGEADHDPPLATLRAMGLDPDDPAHMRPAHGGSARCWVCDPARGKACNQVRGARPVSVITTRVTSRQW